MWEGGTVGWGLSNIPLALLSLQFSLGISCMSPKCCSKGQQFWEAVAGQQRCRAKRNCLWMASRGGRPSGQGDCCPLSPHSPPSLPLHPLQPLLPSQRDGIPEKDPEKHVAWGFTTVGWYFQAVPLPAPCIFRKDHGGSKLLYFHLRSQALKDCIVPIRSSKYLYADLGYIWWFRCKIFFGF